MNQLILTGKQRITIASYFGDRDVAVLAIPGFDDARMIHVEPIIFAEHDTGVLVDGVGRSIGMSASAVRRMVERTAD